MTTLEMINKICEMLLGLYVLASISIILEVQRKINRKLNELIFQIEQYRNEQVKGGEQMTTLEKIKGEAYGK